MALDYAKMGQLPNAPMVYDPQHQRELLRALELYFSQLDSDMPNHAEKYTAKIFVGVRFYGGRYFGDGSYLTKPFQRFDSAASQIPLAVDIAYPVQLDNAEFPGTGITLSAGTHMDVSQQGTYQVDFQLQFNNSAANTAIVQVWLRKNGVDIPNSNSRYAVPGKVGGSFPAVTMCQQSFIGVLAAGDYLEVVWSPDALSIALRAYPALVAAPGVNPAIPATPSAVVIVALLQSDMPLSDVLPLPLRLRPP